MNYKKYYNELIEGRKKNILTENYAIHHIIPKCCGGTNDQSNLVKLSYREHYIAHLLLAMDNPNNYGLQCSVQRIINGSKKFKYNQFVYNIVRKRRNYLCGIKSKEIFKNKTIFKNIYTNENKLLDVNDELVKNGLYVGINKGNKLYNTKNKNYITVKDNNGKYVRILKENFYNNDEYTGINAGKSGLWDKLNKLNSKMTWYQKIMFKSYKKDKIMSNRKYIITNIFSMYDYITDYFSKNNHRISFDYKDFKNKMPELFYQKVNKPLERCMFYIKNGWNPYEDKQFIEDYKIYIKLLEKENENN